MIHYHGTPITPRRILNDLAGRNFCISYAAPNDIEWCCDHGQALMLDNGAFSMWRAGKPTDWPGYYGWCEKWLDRHTFAWAVIPDVIGGSEDENDKLLTEWYVRMRDPRGAPVWHMHESLDRLKRLANGYPRICFGSSGEYATVGDSRWHRRAEEAWNALDSAGLVGRTWVHMLRGMALSSGPYPFQSCDSTDVARNHAGTSTRPRKDARRMVDRWDAIQPAPVWRAPLVQTQLDTGSRV